MHVVTMYLGVQLPIYRCNSLDRRTCFCVSQELIIKKLAMSKFSLYEWYQTLSFPRLLFLWLERVGKWRRQFILPLRLGDSPEKILSWKLWWFGGGRGGGDFSCSCGDPIQKIRIYTIIRKKEGVSGFEATERFCEEGEKMVAPSYSLLLVQYRKKSFFSFFILSQLRFCGIPRFAS